MKALLLCVVTAAVVWTSQQPREYRPMPFPLVDEARGNDELLSFRRRLLDVVERRDLDALVEMSSRTKTDRGDVPANVVRYRFTDVNELPWEQLSEALSLGGSFTTTRGALKGRREFCAPYVYSAYPSELPDELEGKNLPWAIIHEGTRVRESAQSSSRIVATLGPSLVMFIDRVEPDVFNFKQRDAGWVLIQLSPSRKGYVDWRDARSPDDWHVCIALESGGWAVTAFAQYEFRQRP
jgi:hypothetical protein